MYAALLAISILLSFFRDYTDAARGPPKRLIFLWERNNIFTLTNSFQLHS